MLAAIEAPGLPPRGPAAALARLDLALALTAAGKHDEAARVALEAVRSGRLAPLDGRRAREIVLAAAERGVHEAAELAEAYREACGTGSRPAVGHGPTTLAAVAAAGASPAPPAGSGDWSAGPASLPEPPEWPHLQDADTGHRMLEQDAEART